MTFFFKSKRNQRVAPVLIALVFLSACRGGEFCGALSNPVEDTDADCVVTDSDDCPENYNPGQIDIDEDGVGNACDIDDSDASCGPVGTTCTGSGERINAPIDLAAYSDPLFLTLNGVPTALSSSCRAYLVACSGEFIGYLSDDETDDFSIANPTGPYGDSASGVSLFNSLGFYGRDFTACSAFNTEAPTPPAVFCESDAGADQDAFAGYLTLNPLIENGLNACDVLSGLELAHPACD